MSVRRDYVCTACDHRFEYEHKTLKEPSKRKCPACKKNKVEVFFGEARIFSHVYNEPSSFIHQADRNSKKEKHLAQFHDYQKKTEFEEKYGVDYETSKKENERIEKINRMTPEQQTRYVETGEGL